MGKIITIAKNTFIEIIRQPVYGIIIAAVLLMLFLSPSLTMYSMADDDKLLREIGLSTLFLASLFVGIFAASGAVADEIENKTILTVLTKPVRRPVFVLAKFFGIFAAVALAHLITTIALLMTIRHGVMATAAHTHDWTVLSAAGIGITVTILLSAFFNYVNDWKFSSTAVILAAIFSVVSITFLAFIDRNWQFNPAGNGINVVDIYGSVLLLLGAMVIAALALAFSVRFNIVTTLSACVGIFLLGLVSDYIFGRFAETHIWARIGRFIVPNLQIFWISDAIYEGSTVPGTYILIGASYALCYTAAILFLAMAIFEQRQVGS